MKNNKRTNVKKLGLAVLVLITMFSFVSCSLVTNLAGMLIHSATDTLYNFIASYFDIDDPDNAIYGSHNDLAVGFESGNMVAFWDDYGDYSYSVTVSSDDDEQIYDIGNDAFSLDLAENGYSYEEQLAVSLYGTNEANGQAKLLANYDYDGISQKHYQAYTANMTGGWNDLDRYIATRYELFEMFNYIIIFQPDKVEKVENNTTYYNSEITLYLGYDYLSIYPEGTTIEDAYNTEIKSAISAFDDSAGYNYSHSLESNFVECSIFLRFSYQAIPTLTTDTHKIYTQSSFGFDSDMPHYTLQAEPRNRNFAIDSVQKTVSVTTSDQLYFALKRGYKPMCVEGSNAEYIYNHMRIILARLNSELISPAQKVHYIYDYLVDTVIYDYEFVENLPETTTPEAGFFLYKCLYMEGVFGFTNEKTFDASRAVAICDGIAKAVLCMCTIEGIPVIKVSGHSNGVPHAWNKVQINGAWYLVDATWGNVRKPNSKVENFSHQYLLVADDAGHIEDKWIDYPPAPKEAAFPY